MKFRQLLVVFFYIYFYNIYRRNIMILTYDKIENDLNLSNEKQIQYTKASQDNFFIPKKEEKNINFFNNILSNQFSCDIMSYYYSTKKYFLNSE